MTKLYFAAAALFLVSASAHAVNLTGTWKGTGRAVDSKGKPIACESVTLTFTQTPASLAFTSAFVCEGQPITIPNDAMEIRAGGELFYKNVKSGTLTGTTLDVTGKSRGYVLRSKAAFTEKDMNLNALVSVGNNPAPVLSFEAVLHR